MDCIPTGIRFLDLATGGFHRKKPYFVFGASGTGKSILGLQYVTAGLERGEGALYVCRERPEDLIQQAERLGFPLSEHIQAERLALLEYDADFHDIVTRQGPEAVLDELASQVDPGTVRRVVFDPIDPFFSGIEEEAVLRTQLRSLARRTEDLDWTPLLLGDDATVANPQFVLRVFSEVCWGLCELRRDGEGSGTGHQLLVYKMRNVNLERSRFPFRIGEQGIVGLDDPRSGETKRASFARFRPAAAPSAAPADAPRVAVPAPAPVPAATPLRVAPSTATAHDDELLDDAALAQIEHAVRARAGALPPPRKRALALVAAADPALRREAIQAFGDEIETLEALDGESALGIALARRPDLLVLHAALPRVNAPGLCRILREHGGDVPLLFLTSGPARGGARARWLELGADDVLEAPFDAGELLVCARRLIDRRGGVPPHWPTLDADAAIKRLGPQRLDAADLDAHVAEAAARARAHGLPLSLLGYEFRFVDGPEGARFVERFIELLAGAIRAGDALSRIAERRVVAILLDADVEGARRVLQRTHEGALAAADDVRGPRGVKPKALYRLLATQPDPLEGEAPQTSLVSQLYALAPQLLEQEQDDRPGEPMEKYPLLESVFSALTGDAVECLSPLDGARCAVEQEPNSGMRRVAFGEFVYRVQPPDDETPAGLRVSRGARIVWVERVGTGTARAVARIEDGRVFRGRDA